MKSTTWLIIFANWLLRRIYDEDLYDEIEGDLFELYTDRLISMSRSKASWLYLWDAVLSIRNMGLNKKSKQDIDRFGMVGNYFSMAWRHTTKDKAFSGISVFGLSVSMAACFLIFQYAFFELHYDRHISNYENIYRLVTKKYAQGQELYSSAMSSPLFGEAITDRISEFQERARLLSTRGWFDCSLRYSKNNDVRVFNEHNLYFADNEYLAMFSYEMRYGNVSDALEKPYSIVLSENAAKRYFGNDPALGEVMHLKGSNDDHDYTVTGILKNPPLNSHLDGDIFLSMNSVSSNPNFNFADFYTYLKALPESDSKTLQTKLSLITPEILSPTENGNLTIELQPISNIHLYSTLQDEIKESGNVKAIYFLFLIACSILIIAWINYINFTTSRSISRAKEVGVRKVSGASRIQLLYQFVSEAILINMISVGIAFLLVFFFGSYFYKYIGLSSSYSTAFNQFNELTIILLIGIFLVGIFSSGFYPARILASYNPSIVLKGKNFTREGNILRKALVVFQFSFAIGLMIAVIAFNRQLYHIKVQPLGIDIAQTMVVRAPANIDSSFNISFESFKAQLQSNSLVENITSSSDIPGKKIGWTGAVDKEKSKLSLRHKFVINVVDPDFIPSYKLTLMAGRNFTASDFPLTRFGQKIEPVILNRTAIAQLGFADEKSAVGETVYWDNNECRIIGVIDDYHQQSLKNGLEPMLLTAYTGPLLSFKLTGSAVDDHVERTITTIHRTWDSFFPDNAFDYFFLDDFFDGQYINDEQLMNVFQFFCLLALTISCLGLLGIASFNANQRTKEVGIRKVLGASTAQLINLLTKEFLTLILIATCIALPLSYVGVNIWLEGFAYHINLTLWIFIIPVLLILVIAFVTIYSQTLQAIRKNPSDSLKYD